jgi:DNA-binding response OmpR family regulator
MVGDQTVWLTPLEAEILDVLIANFGKVITYDRLIFNIFESGVPRIGAHKNEIDDPKATIQVSLVKLRRKMKVVPASIETRWGIGLVLTAEGDTDLKLEAA